MSITNRLIFEKVNSEKVNSEKVNSNKGHIIDSVLGEKKVLITDLVVISCLHYCWSDSVIEV